MDILALRPVDHVPMPWRERYDAGLWRHYERPENEKPNRVEPISGWECCFVHRALGLILSVYADDFKMAGQKHLSKGWQLIKTKLRLDDPTPLGDYLGRGQQEIFISPPEAHERLKGVQQLPDPNQAAGNRSGGFNLPHL